MSLDEIEEQYSQKAADKLMMISEMGTSYGGDSMEYQEQRYGDTEEHEYSSNYAYNPEESRIVRSVRVIERQYYQLKDCMFYVDPVTGDKRAVPYEWGK